MRLEDDPFMGDEEQVPEEFEQPELDQGKCGHRLIILITYSLFNSPLLILHVSQLCKPYDLISPTFTFLVTPGVLSWVV